MLIELNKQSLVVNLYINCMTTEFMCFKDIPYIVVGTKEFDEVKE